MTIKQKLTLMQEISIRNEARCKAFTESQKST